MKSTRSIWLVSNKFFNDSNETSSLFYKGFTKNLNYGYKFNDDFIGYSIEIKSNFCIISNDSLATLPIYYFFQNGVWACSNNIWELCKIENFNVNWNWFRKNSFYYNTPKEGETFIENINFLKIGDFIKCDKNNLQIKKKEQILFQESVKNKISKEDDVINNIIFNLDNFFEHWKNVPNLYLGNSGGFDSRLMRAFLHKHDVEYKPYTILRKKQNYFFKSTTEWSANKCDDLYGKSRPYFLNPNKKCDMDDLIWNPLGTHEASKVSINLCNEVNKKDNPYVFCGGNG